MKRNRKEYFFSPDDLYEIKQKILNWTKPFSIFLLLDSNQYHHYPYSKYELLLGVSNQLNPIVLQDMQAVQNWIDENQDWLFGHLAYDYKNQLEKRLSSKNKSIDNWDNLNFFCPEIVCYIVTETNSLIIESIDVDPEIVYNQILRTDLAALEETLPKVKFHPHTNKEDYTDKIRAIKKHIVDGDCYELNYCCMASAKVSELNTHLLFQKLNALSPASFAAFYRFKNQFLICASPERYLQKNGKEIVSMPIKGTSKRSVHEEEDLLLKKQLSESIKNKAENVMIVDLVRNDLARSCVVGSIEVVELFGIYSFPQVHQMISTVKGQLNDSSCATDCINKSFPMGSMTGAPKIKVMQIIDDLENQSRGLFSGAVGYFNPNGDFDFNVIIRSLFYNESNENLHYQTGGAITIDSDENEEYEEMKLKAWALERVFR